MKIAINGFGRIGRSALKIALEKNLEITAINDLGELENLAYLFKYDSAYGVYKKEIKTEKEALLIDGKKIKVFNEKDPLNLPWKELGIDIVLECTGFFTDRENCQKHLMAGAKKVLISAPTKDETIKTIILGCNEKEIKENDDILSMASCTTNCIAPIMKVLEANFGIEKSLMSTIHSYTATQMLVDSPSGKKDMRRGRAAAQNIVPSTTGAATAVALMMPQLKGKFDGIAFRVPTLTGSVSDIVLITKKETTKEEINKTLKKASEKELKGIMALSEEALVSQDIVGNNHSCIIQSELTNVVAGNLVKIVAWYDNEWGYAAKLIDLIKLLIR